MRSLSNGKKCNASSNSSQEEKRSKKIGQEIAKS